MNTKKSRIAIGSITLAIAALAVSQGQIIKLIGIGAAVQKFGPDINKSINGIAKHKDTPADSTKVVPILSVGSRKAIGAAQVMGPKEQIDKVKSVAQLDQNIFGGAVKVRVLIPISSEGLSDIKKVDNVGVSATVDFKL
jgi:hypothetical protein